MYTNELAATYRRVKAPNVSSARSVSHGSVIGLSHRNIYFNDMLPLVFSATAHADDCTVCFIKRFFTGRNIIESQNKTSSILKQWSDTWQGSFSPFKTQTTVTISFIVEMEVSFAPLKKILGVIVDKKLTFASHVSKIQRLLALIQNGTDQVSWTTKCASLYINLKCDH